MTEREERIISIEQAIKTGKRITKKEAWELMRKATANHESLCMIWKIPNKEYQKWYNDWKKQTEKRGGIMPTTLEDETTYLVYAGAKAFDSGKGGYSIFAQSLGCLKRQQESYELDRIEHYECEWAIIYGEGK